MIIPSIDLRGGHSVQLIEGREQALDAGAPLPLLQRFRLAGEVAVIDLDRALGSGDNSELIESLCREAACRVGGGIRTREQALRWLDAGARKIIVGTAAQRPFLRSLPRERLLVALDAREGEVVVDGWRERTGRELLERVDELKDDCAGFLVTFVEREGRLGGTDLELAREVVRRAGDARVTIAGGVTTPEEVAALDAMGADAQVGMALYTGRLALADAFAAPMTSDRPDGLWPTVVCDESGATLGLAWSNLESLREAFASGRGVYHSRRRGLWRKGESSGNTQELLAVDVDCDRDALRFTVRQGGEGFCHLPRRGCFGEDRGVARLARRLEERRQSAPEGSYSARLFGDPELLASKLREEAEELVAAATKAEVVHEAADLLYFTLTRAIAAGVSLADLEQELELRELKQTRRGGDAKEPIR